MSSNLAYLGDRLFGRGVRLQLAAFVLANRRRGHFTAPAVARELATESKYVLQEFARLAELGMVERLEFTTRPQGYRFSFKVHPRWEIIRAAVRAEETQLKQPLPATSRKRSDNVTVLNPHDRRRRKTAG